MLNRNYLIDSRHLTTIAVHHQEYEYITVFCACFGWVKKSIYTFLYKECGSSMCTNVCSWQLFANTH